MCRSVLRPDVCFPMSATVHCEMSVVISSAHNLHSLVKFCIERLSYSQRLGTKSITSALQLHQPHYLCVHEFRQTYCFVKQPIAVVKLCMPYVFNTVTIYPQTPAKLPILQLDLHPLCPVAQLISAARLHLFWRNIIAHVSASCQKLPSCFYQVQEQNMVPLVFRFDEGSCSSAYPERVWLSVSI